MIQEETEKIAIFPVCLERLTTDIYFTSDDYLYHKKCFRKLNFKSPISRQDFSYHLPVNKLINDKIYFEKILIVFIILVKIQKMMMIYSN